MKFSIFLPPQPDTKIVLVYLTGTTKTLFIAKRKDHLVYTYVYDLLNLLLPFQFLPRPGFFALMMNSLIHLLNV